MNRFTDKFDKADKSFDNIYGNALSQLKGMSPAELAQVTPDTTSKEVYNKLVAVVEEAARKNLSQAEFVDKVKQLGANVKNIVAKIPAIAAWF